MRYNAAMGKRIGNIIIPGDANVWPHEQRTAVERNLKRARWQSGNIVFDSRRMKGIPDAAIERELRKWSSELSGVSHVLFVNRHGVVIDVK